MAKNFFLHGQIFWDENLKFYVLCNDFFFWACSDAEDITEKNFHELEKAIKDAGEQDGPLLFCARMRKMRPQGAAYCLAQQKNWPLFDKCGPPRKAELGNPQERPFPIT